MLEQFLKWPKLIWSTIYEKISEKAKKANTSVKDYLGDEANIYHISSVVYEGIPFFFKFSLKADSFNEKFKKHFTAFRDKMYSYDDEVNAEKKEMEQAQAVFKERALNPEDSIEVFNSKDYPNGISTEEVHAKINAMVEQAKNEKKEESTRAKLLKEWEESQKIIAERAASIDNPEELAKMTHFTSDMSEEEILEKFLNVVSESRAKNKAPIKKKPAKAKTTKVVTEKPKAVRTPRKKKTEE